MKQNDNYKSKDILLVIGLFLVVFVIGADSFIISPLLPAIEKDYAVTTSQAALAVTIYALCYAVGSPFFGPLGDKFNKRKLLITGLLIFLIGSFICAQATNIEAFYIGRAVAGIGAAVTMPNIWATVGSYFTGKKLNIVMGITMSALSLSIAIGVPMGTLLSQLSNWHMAFWGSILLTLLAFGVLLLVVPNLMSGQGKLKYLASFQTLLKSRRALLSLSINLVWMFGFYLIYTFLGTFLNQNFHFNTAQTGNIFIAYGLSNFIASFCGGHLLSKLGAMKDVILNGFLSMIFILGLVICQNQLWGIIIFLILLAVAQGLGVTALTTYIVDVVPDKRSTVMSFNSSFLYLGLTLGSLIGAILYSRVGFTGLGIIAIMALGIAIIETLRLKK
ncbi:MFS transporter [Companilactobacillus kimchii]|uniref:MFS family major facilitator transporter n=2 Tax=Companilactobacillus kimchii TaxID=2801452 RepID=A0ABR5NU29_9LACO|nr:MFS transporter [Companilactobacillus kimchii]GEO47752.1 MFS transporter [Companilactobacillus paralimentarius]KAE9558757.1 MFS transporter [Companilactobacillus kimchii]KAE9560986.1 MFS transporter [Companilactobacillus kimchii]KRK51891.1 MFS family major facilitator transporter [Companilactobacillus kimchii DSM 13961 = JCM 10707]OWF33817.1 Multidrug resistance protein [Companilactobacillus kimchii]